MICTDEDQREGDDKGYDDSWELTMKPQDKCRLLQLSTAFGVIALV